MTQHTQKNKIQNNQAKANVSNLKRDEKILVVSKNKLFPEEVPAGFKPMISFDEYENIITQHKEFLWRSEMETNQSYKQICPYLVFSFQDRFFIMQRKSSASEQRLKNKYSFGIGGHIREEDITNKNMVDWAHREFHEEVNYTGSFTVQPLGILNDESNDVGKVHTGFVFLLKGNSSDISIRSELKHGQLLTLEECAKHQENMETWSQLVFEFLKQKV